jgi:hypothetical protein
MNHAVTALLAVALLQAPLRSFDDEPLVPIDEPEELACERVLSFSLSLEASREGG